MYKVQSEQQLILKELKTKQKALANQLGGKQQALEQNQQNMEKRLKNKQLTLEKQQQTAEQQLKSKLQNLQLRLQTVEKIFTKSKSFSMLVLHFVISIHNKFSELTKESRCVIYTMCINNFSYWCTLYILHTC